MRDKMIYLVAVALTVAACQEAAGPAEQVDLGEANQAVQAACYTPNFQVAYTLVLPPTPPFTWVGVVSGDLIGTAVQVFDLEPELLNSHNVIAMATVSWDITGGVIPELVGRQFQTRSRFLAVFTPDHAPEALNQGHEKALSGISQADLTLHGMTAAGVSQVNYQGLICP